MAGTADFGEFLRDVQERIAASAIDEVAGEIDRRVRRYCGEHGIPQSVFLGRVRTERTTVTYKRDDDGNLVVTRVTECDPEWLSGDVAAALRWQAERDSLCSGCGQPRRESFDRANRYAAQRHECGGCAAQQRSAYLEDKNRGKNAPPRFGSYYAVTKLE